MRKLVTALVLAAAIPTIASAGTVSAEYLNGSDPDTSAYKFQANGSMGKINLGAEVQAKQAAHNGALTNTFSVKAGPQLPDIAGFQTVANVELGKSEATGKDFEFWGASVGASRKVFGPVTASVGYRHREGFTTANLKEDRFEAGLSMALNKKNDLGVTYYHYNDKNVSSSNKVLGIGLTHKF